MVRYLFNRLGQSALLLIGVSIIGFALMHLAPGGPLAVYTLNPTVTAQDIERVKHQFGLDQPVYVQYFKWAGGLVTGQWGYSFFGGRPVSTIVAGASPRHARADGIKPFARPDHRRCHRHARGGAPQFDARLRDRDRGDDRALPPDLLVRPARHLPVCADTRDGCRLAACESYRRRGSR